MENKNITVGELIKFLSQYPATLAVQMMVNDCYGGGAYIDELKSCHLIDKVKITHPDEPSRIFDSMEELKSHLAFIAGLRQDMNNISDIELFLSQCESKISNNMAKAKETLIIDTTI